MKALFLAGVIALFSLVAHPVAAQVIFDAFPSVRIESSAIATSRTVLTSSESQKSRITIERRGDRYFWKTRENRELSYRKSGAFVVLFDETGGGSIKIFDTEMLPSFLREEGPRWQYFEQLNLWMTTITYFGAAE